MATTLSQECTVIETSDNRTVFQVISSITAYDSTDLPTDAIFVHQIKDTSDPKSDVFVRVCNILDLTTLLRSRDSATQAGQTLYANNSMLVQFDDVTTATNAKNLIQSRVANLITDWGTYTTQFITPGSVTLPLADPDLVRALTATFSDYKKKAAAAIVALQTANTALETAKSSSSSAGTTLANAIQDSQACATTQGILQQGITDENTFVQAAYAFMAWVGRFTTAVQNAINNGDPASAVSSDLATFNSAVDTFKTAQSNESTAMAELNQALTRVTSSCSSKSLAVTTATTAKNTADVTLATATSSQAAAANASAAAQAAQDTALANVLAVCPTFDPSTA